MNSPTSHSPFADPNIDPVTFEVIRHRLWAINDDQAIMAARLSGSPIVYEGLDFNAGLLTADGRSLFTGVYILHHAATLDVFVKHVIDLWQEDISPGDMFFTNDPWFGALHSNDGILIAPIFAQNRIVCWAGIVMHDQDVGSPIPGSFVVGAADRFGEAPLFPPVRIVEKGAIRNDIERAFVRNHRMPDLTKLNLRARIAALNSTTERILDLVDTYGVEVVIACQDAIVRYVGQIVASRLAEIPDGSWMDRIYHDHNGRTPDIYPIQCRLIKVGSRMTFDFTGTAKQAPGGINCARPALEGSVLGVVLATLCYDLPWSIGALRPLVDIIAEPGTINNAESPAGVSMASVMAAISTQDVVANVVGKFLLASDKYRSEAQACWSSGINGQIYAGVDRDGRPFALPTMDVMGGGGGARTFADGLDSGGIFHSVSSSLQNVETSESRLPILQLYRKERTDSSGPGRFRGGVGIEAAVMPHKGAGPLTAIIMASGVSQPEGHGLAGGGPGCVKLNLVLRGSNIREILAAGVVPVASEDVIASASEYREAKDHTELGDTDVIVYVIPGGGGYGDPLRRDPRAVAKDLRDGLVSTGVAESVFGVACSDGNVDEAATGTLRATHLRERLHEGRPVDTSFSLATVDGGDVLHPVSDTVEMVSLDGRRLQRCTVCRCKLADDGEDYLRGTLVRELPLSATSPINRSGREDLFVLRQYVCRVCGTAVALHVQLRDEPRLSESLFPAVSDVGAIGPGTAETDGANHLSATAT